MTTVHRKRAFASFHTQGRLLQELGERLVAKADVALMELIKNAYDADATSCTVTCDDTQIVIGDDGHGMTEQEFLDKWMRIATPDKQRLRASRRFARSVTGSKGIGRFAVRFLGHTLRLETVANDGGAQSRTLLSVDFDWEELDKSDELHAARIPYEVVTAPSERSPGTTLVITGLRSPGGSIINRAMRTELLGLVHPYAGLDAGKFNRRGHSKKDPGFDVILPEASGTGEDGLASAVIDKHYARLTIEHSAGSTKFVVTHGDGRTLLERIRASRSNISRGFRADIRYFPRRAGMFRGTEVDGRIAWSWIRKNSGVGVVDHGFRVRPYGYEQDDWLSLSWDSAHNRRTWRSELMRELFPMSEESSSKPRNNPMLYLPNFHQLVGAVFVESTHNKTSGRPSDLTPSMDREGFVNNEAFKELQDIVRAGLEMLAYADHREQRRLEDVRRRRESKELRADLRKAADYVRKVPGLADDDRERVVAQFTHLAKGLSNVEEYHKIASAKLELMGLLGVIAGFVTHEMQRMLHGIEKVLRKLKRAYGSDPATLRLISEVEDAYNSVVEQLDFSTGFIGALQGESKGPESVNALAAMELVTGKFQRLAAERGIVVECEVEADVLSPRLPRALYAGVVLNLYTNALKATMGGSGARRDARVVLKAWNEPKIHIVEVADTGIGIPPEIQERIWDPLFTTTSSEQYSPLGSGMGLGLALVKSVVGEVKGRIAIVDPPPGYTTCFRVEFRR